MKAYFSLALLLQPFTSISQKFNLPPIPSYDSVYVDYWNDIIKEKTFYLKGKRVFEIGYNTGSILYTPFTHIGGGEEDSCYAYFNGKNGENYDFYYIANSYIINDKYSETSKIFKYKKFKWNNSPIEEGNYYFIKQMYESTISHYKKYKIGKWIQYDSTGKPVEIIDYDNATINGQPIKFSGKLSIIDSLKTLAENKLIETYGKDFVSKYIRFNLARSGYHPYKNLSPEIPSGYSILEQTEKDIHYVDLSYDIILGEERFNTIHLRISKDGKFLGKSFIRGYATEYFYLTQGLDSLNNKKFHSNIINWKKVALSKGFDITSKDFNVRMDVKPTSSHYGELRMVLEQITEKKSTKYSNTHKLRQLYINPWTGEIKEKTDTQGTESIIIEGIGE